MASVTDNSTESSTPTETDFTRNIKLGVFIALEPPSLICLFLLLYCLIFDRTLRRSLHYHSILALLIVSLLTSSFDIMRIINFLYTGIVTPQTKINCLIWQWYDYVLYGHSNILLCWASIERYILIFHGSLFNTAKRRLFFHYLPFLAITVYLAVFYGFAIFFIPCDQFDFSLMTSGIPCYAYQPLISLYDNIVHNWIPLLFNIILSIALCIRVLYRNRVGIQQNAQRRRHYKMVLQLLLISCLHLTCVLPYALVVFIQMVTNSPDYGAYIQTIYFYYLYYVHALLQPFACISCLPEVVKKITNCWKKQIRRNTTVMPVNNASRR